VYSQILVVFLAFNLQMREMCILWFSVDIDDRSEQCTHTFWEKPNGSGTRSMSFLIPHWEDNIPSWSQCYHMLVFLGEIKVLGSSRTLNWFRRPIN
jgi:hypothetical protein